MTIAAYWLFSLIWIRAAEKEPAEDAMGPAEGRYKNWALTEDSLNQIQHSPLNCR